MRVEPPLLEYTISMQHSKHSVYELHVHLVFITKYRRRVISDRVRKELIDSIRRACLSRGCVLVEADGEADHLHLLVIHPPKISISQLAHLLKGVSSRHIRLLAYPEVRSKLWGASFWSPSYCAVSCGGAPLEIIKRYIQEQRAA